MPDTELRELIARQQTMVDLHDIRIHEQAKYISEFKGKADSIHDLLDDIKKELSVINKALFVGNGTKSLLSRCEVMESLLFDRVALLQEVEQKIDVVEVETRKSSKKYNVILISVVLFWLTFLADLMYGVGAAKMLLNIIGDVK